MSPYADPQRKREAARRFRHERQAVPRKPLTEPVITGVSVVHFVGAETGLGWLDGDSHESLCGAYSGRPEPDIADANICRSCLRIRAAADEVGCADEEPLGSGTHARVPEARAHPEGSPIAGLCSRCGKPLTEEERAWEGVGGTVRDRLYVNETRTLLVRIWASGTVEVASRDHSSDIWGPPVYLEEER